MLLAC
jgi:hypothetical protein